MPKSRRVIEDGEPSDDWSLMEDLPSGQTKVLLRLGDGEEAAELRTSRAYHEKRWQPYKRWVSLITMRPITREPEGWKPLR